jgi:hypothetical protein
MVYLEDSEAGHEPEEALRYTMRWAPKKHCHCCPTEAGDAHPSVGQGGAEAALAAVRRAAAYSTVHRAGCNSAAAPASETQSLALFLLHRAGKHPVGAESANVRFSLSLCSAIYCASLHASQTLSYFLRFQQLLLKPRKLSHLVHLHV